MANKIIDISDGQFDSAFNMLSQTPNNYDEKNFYIKTLQQKIDREWKYRHNRVSVEFEVGWNNTDYRNSSSQYPISSWEPLEVIVQAVKTDKGTDISEDCRRLVFKDIRENRFSIGSKFRFPENYDIFAAQKVKNTWLVTNKDSVSITSSVVIERCNGTIGSIYEDEQKIAHFHYEPVIQGRELSSTSFRYNEVAVAQQSGLIITCQHNKYTRDYKINQRFIIGYDQVYRVKAINKFYANSTGNPQDIGLMTLYLEVTEKSAYDDFVNRIAYEQEPKIHIENNSVNDEEFVIGFKLPSTIPTYLTEETIKFVPQLTGPYGAEYDNVRIYVECSLENYPQNKVFDMDNNPYFKITYEGNNFYLQRTKIYLAGDLNVKCYIPAEYSPTGAEISSSFTIVMKKMA